MFRTCKNNQVAVSYEVNVSGVIKLKNSPNPVNAVKLIEFLSSAKAQKMYADVNYEYPVKSGVPLSKLVKSWGKLHADEINLSEIAGYRARASELVDKVAFDSGP